MPLYEYKCDTCGHVIEILQSSTTTQTEGYCPNCEAVRNLSKLFSLTAAPQGHGSDGFGGSLSGGGGCGHGGFT
ncbi:MAG: zinc ribbon domain-containing protein [Calditrichaeota bacterium]|nr:zinc ribbon domain-containing protein [Calditrichota bacterium]